MDDFLPLYHDSTHALFGEELLDETPRVLNQLIYTSLDKPYIEIEGKIGVLCDKETMQRIKMDYNLIRSETVVKANADYSTEFQSTVGLNTFKHLNEHLNKRCGELGKYKHDNTYKGPLIMYKRVKEIDRFYADKLRVAIDPDTQVPIRAIRKNRLENINMYCPYQAFDYRISVSQEFPAQIPPDHAIARQEREKDRLSYFLGNSWRLDITTVKSFKLDNYGKRMAKHPDNQTTYEVELELETKTIQQEWLKLKNGSPNQFTTLTSTFLNHMRKIAEICTAGVKK